MFPAPRVLAIGAGLAINGSKLTDHNRSPISLSPERLENRKRMANGTMRNFVIATKRKIKTSWDLVPAIDGRTVDGFWGALSMQNFYNNTFGEFTLRVTFGTNSHEDILVMFNSFDCVLRKRSKYADLYNVDITFEEV
jgi:hypothetical protein